jgi:fructose transport system substrate-binding protein
LPLPLARAERGPENSLQKQSRIALPVLLAAALLASACTSSHDVSVCLVTKTDTNPFFVKMKEGARAKAAELGVELTALAGREEGDNEGQIAAIESCIARGVDGILLVPTDSNAIVDTVRKARGRGIMVIALDTPLEPIDAADATFATDNFKAGELVGAWARARLGPAASTAKIAYLNLLPSRPTVDVLRNQGFMQGFGIELGDPSRIGDERDARNVCHDVTNGNPEGGRRAMESCLQRDPEINVVYTINEPAAAGAYEALKAFGKAGDVLLVSIDGGCPGVRNVADGSLGATAQQYPLAMAAQGVAAIANFVRTGERPAPPAGAAFVDTGAVLVTDEPANGVESIDAQTGLDRCWG